MNIADNFTFNLGWGNTHEDWKAVHVQKNVIQQHDGIYILTERELITGWRYKDDKTVNILQEYSTGLMVSKQQWLYGEFEAEMTLPDFVGSWPAFWLYPMFNDGLHATNYDEIDFMEQFRKNWFSKYHIQGNVHKNGTMTPRTKWVCSRRMKLTGIWKDNAVLMYLNGKLFHSVYGKENVSQRAMNVIVGMGVGNWNVKLTDKSTMIIHTLKVNGVSLI